MIVLLLLCLFATASLTPAGAQDAADTTTETAEASDSDEQSADTPKAKGVVTADLSEDERKALVERKIKLAAQIHKYRPISLVIESAAAQIAANYPEGERETARRELIEHVEYQKLREESIVRMADIYTENELKVMLDFYSAPEFQSIRQKDIIYLQLVRPSIVRQLDAALMSLRTGKTPQKDK